MSYMKKPSLPQQQNELRKLIDERLESEEYTVKERIYQWLNSNQYFTDNELFDFYFCIAQNLAAVELMGASGEKIVKAKTELEESAEAYLTKVRNISEKVERQLQDQLRRIDESQEKLDTRLKQVLEGLKIEHRNLKTISTGLVNSTSSLLVQQKKLLAETKIARNVVSQIVVGAWSISVISLFGFLAIGLITGKS